jgi:hypothetical protein
LLPSTFSSCANAGACATCLHCTMLSLPTSSSPNTALSIYDAYQTQSIDEWLRQVSACPSSALALSNTSDSSMAMHARQPHTPPSWDTFKTSESTIVPETWLAGIGCNAECMCPPGLCQCEDHDRTCDHDYDAFPRESRDGGLGLTFATSGERASCSAVSQEGTGLRVSTFDDTFVHESGHYPDTTAQGDETACLIVHEAPGSRSPSTSSESSTSRMSTNNRPVLAKHTPPMAIGHVQGLMTHTRGVQSLQNLNIHSGANAAKSSPMSISLPPSTSWNRNIVTYAGSNSDSEISLDDRYPQYDPSLDGIQLH